MSYNNYKGPKEQNVGTPSELYDEWNKEFKFDHDPCPLYGEDNPAIEDGLTKPEWGTSNYVNPPFNRIQEWLVKGLTESHKGKQSVFLLPVRTDQDWFHRFCNNDKLKDQVNIRYLKSGVKFQQYKKKAPWPCMLVVMKGKKMYEKILK
jgi:hypothetical protein